MTSDDPHGRESEKNLETAAPHPEEMKATVRLRVGNVISVRATVRTTPAGLVTTALLMSAILIPLVWLARDRARKRLGTS